MPGLPNSSLGLSSWVPAGSTCSPQIPVSISSDFTDGFVLAGALRVDLVAPGFRGGSGPWVPKRRASRPTAVSSAPTWPRTDGRRPGPGSSSST